MTAVKIFTPVNRLKETVTERYGRDREQLARASEARVEQLAPQLRAQVAEKVARLVALRQVEVDHLCQHTLEIGDAAMGIAELAGAAGQPRLGEAARGVLAMLPALRAGDSRAANAMLVHLTSLELISGQEPGGGDDLAAVLARLAGLRQALGLPD